MFSEFYNIQEHAALSRVGNDSSANKAARLHTAVHSWKLTVCLQCVWSLREQHTTLCWTDRIHDISYHIWICIQLLWPSFREHMITAGDYLFMNAFTNPLYNTSKIFLTKSLSLTLNNSAVPWLLKFVVAFQIFSGLKVYIQGHMT